MDSETVALDFPFYPLQINNLLLRYKKEESRAAKFAASVENIVEYVKRYRAWSISCSLDIDTIPQGFKREVGMEWLFPAHGIEDGQPSQGSSFEAKFQGKNIVFYGDPRELWGYKRCRGLSDVALED